MYDIVETIKVGPGEGKKIYVHLNSDICENNQRKKNSKLFTYLDGRTKASKSIYDEFIITPLLFRFKKFYYYYFLYYPSSAIM